MLNLHTEFQLSSNVWAGKGGGADMHGTNSKNMKNHQKNFFLPGWERMQCVWKIETPQKAHLWTPTKFTYWIWNSYVNPEGVLGVCFHVQKEKKTLISPFLNELGSWFLDMLHDFGLSIDWLNKEQNLKFWPLSITYPVFGHNWILTSGHFYSEISNPPPI